MIDHDLIESPQTVKPGLNEAELEHLLATNPRGFFDNICDQAIELGASDIFWKTGAPASFGVAGSIIKLSFRPITAQEMERIFLAEIMNENQRNRFEQCLDLDMAIEKPAIRLRFNIYYERGHLASVIRLVPLKVPTLEELGLPETLGTLVTKKKGMILVTGPTGCGKSTTLAALINLINTTRACNIVCIEDPIEFAYRDQLAIISQREVGIDTLSFKDALRAVLRQAPNVILIGEMRDTETMSTAMQAAETGHLVLSTVHTNSAAETIERIINMYPAQDKAQISLRLSMTLLGICSQKLVPSLDGHSRVCAAEIMLNSPTIAKMIEEGKIGDIYGQMRNDTYYGMQTMNKSLLGYFCAEKITEQNALAFAGNTTEMRQEIHIAKRDQMTAT